MGEIIVIQQNGNLNLNSVNPLRSVTKAEHKQDLLNMDTIFVTVESVEPINFQVDDQIHYEGRVYRLNSVPKVVKNNEREYIYDLAFDGVQNDLMRKIYFNLDASGFYNSSEFTLTGEIDIFLTVLIHNINNLNNGYTYVLGDFPQDTEGKTLNFSNENCLQVLQKLCQEFSQEFEIIQDISAKTCTIHIRKIGQILPYSFEHGKGKGLYTLIRDNVAESGLVTKMFAYGSSENIPTNYRNFSQKLRMPESFGDFIQSNELIEIYGIIEGVKTYDDIKPTFKGMIDSVGTLDKGVQSIVVPNMDFDLKEKDDKGQTKYLIAGTPAKIHVNKGNLAGYEFEVNDYSHATKTFKIKQFTDERWAKFPDDNIFSFSAGDEFTLLDINMPQVYIDNAELRLKNKAVEDFTKASVPRVQYSLTIAPLFFKKIGSADSKFIGIGDYVNVKDKKLKVDKTSRVNSITRNLLNGYDYKIDIADTYEINLVKTILSDIAETKTIVKKERVRNRQGLLNAYKINQELKESVFDPDGYFDMDKIRPVSIETNMISVGAKSQQLALENVVLEPNLNGDKDSIKISGGKLIHFSIQDTIREWSLVGSMQTGLLNSPYYIYAKCDKTGSFGSFLITTEKIKFNQDGQFYHFLVAILHSPQNGVRYITMLEGATTINGRYVKTGRISSQDGLTYFDLDSGEIKGNIVFDITNPIFDSLKQDFSVGGRNLIRNSKAEKSSAGGWITYELVPELINGEYTLQIWLKNTAQNGGGIGFGNANGYDGFYFDYPVLKDGIYKKTLTLSKGVNTHICLYVNGQTTVEKIKLEKGKTGTDWTPAPEDYDVKFSTLQSGIDNMNISLVDVKTKTDNFTSIQGGLIMSNIISVGDSQFNQNAFLSGVTDAGGNSVRFGAGANYANKNTAPFRVLDNGKMIAENAEITGIINANGGVFKGRIEADSGWFGSGNKGFHVNENGIKSEKGWIALGDFSGGYLSNGWGDTDFVQIAADHGSGSANIHIERSKSNSYTSTGIFLDVWNANDNIALHINRGDIRVTRKDNGEVTKGYTGLVYVGYTQSSWGGGSTFKYLRFEKGIMIEYISSPNQIN